MKIHRCPHKHPNKRPHELAGELTKRRNNSDDSDENYKNNGVGLIRAGQLSEATNACASLQEPIRNVHTCVCMQVHTYACTHAPKHTHTVAVVPASLMSNVTLPL